MRGRAGFGNKVLVTIYFWCHFDAEPRILKLDGWARVVSGTSAAQHGTPDEVS